MLSFLVAAATVFYIAAPLRQAKSSAAKAPVARRRESIRRLEARREDLLRDLKDLEFDYRMQKFEASEYAELRAEMAAQASEVLEKLDALRGSQPANSKVNSKKPARETSSTPAVATQIETKLDRAETELEMEIMIARARRRLGKDAQIANGAPQSTLDEAVDVTEQFWRCACGREMAVSDCFCASCGAARGATERAETERGTTEQSA